MKRLKIGDIIEIKTTKGVAYAQYTHRHPTYGALIRVFNRIYESSQSEFGSCIAGAPSFSCFFPLGAAVNRKIVQIVATGEVASDLREFPLFRAGVIDPATKKVELWWIWDGEKEWQIGNLTEEQRKFPIRGVWNDTYLIEKIESGWTPEADQF